MWLKILLFLGILTMFISPGVADDSYANDLTRQMGLQGRVLWLDAEANMWELSSRQGVADVMRRCKDVNINTVIVDVKPLCGLVLYKSRLAPRLVSFDGKKYPRDYDLLKTVIEEAHKVGISVHAAINVFSEGAMDVPGGPAHKHTAWQVVQYDIDRSISVEGRENEKMPCSDGPYIAGQVGVYGQNTESARELPANTFYVRVDKNGNPLQHGIASGFARLSAPEGGYVLVASGNAGDWLKGMAESGRPFLLSGEESFKRASEMKNIHNAVFVNPLNSEVRTYELGVVRELVEDYDLDGIMLDRMRYPNFYADFSDTTRREFEKFIGKPVNNWPYDIFKRSPIPGEDQKGKLFKSWIKFRAKVMHDFLADVRNVVKSERPDVKLGIYVGSWYPLYYDVGVNWGSCRNKDCKYDWWPDGYEETGYAGLVDYMCTGCYYTHPTRQEAINKGDEQWKSVEAAAEESMNAVKDETFVYGGLYLYQYKNRPDKFAEAIRQCLRKTQGCMIFDLVYVRDYNWWKILKRAFPHPEKAPHDVSGLLEKVREHK